jgi:hypothetical protein
MEQLKNPPRKRDSSLGKKRLARNDILMIILLKPAIPHLWTIQTHDKLFCRSQWFDSYAGYYVCDA